MLYVCLTVSLVSLGIMNVLVAKKLTPYAAVISIVGIWIPGCVMMPVMMQHMFTVPCFILVPIPRVGRKLFAVASVLAMTAAYSLSFRDAVRDDQRMLELREQYPFESVEARLPTQPKPSPLPVALNDKKWDQFERDIEKQWVSKNLFKSLHEERVANFVNSPGFGIARTMSFRRSERGYSEQMPTAPLDQPVPPLPSDAPAGEILSSGGLDDNLILLHSRGVIDFVNPQGFGYVKSRSQVSGFRPHRFSFIPAAGTWAVNSLELVGILVHEAPAVYVSEHLPRMDELNKAKTRMPDAFEKEGLAELEKGEDLFVRGKDNSARMMGAIRNAKQCVECHGGNRGDLLGAFSYRLRKN